MCGQDTGFRNANSVNLMRQGFTMNTICLGMVVTRADQCGRGRINQPWMKYSDCMCQQRRLKCASVSRVQSFNHLSSWRSGDSHTQEWFVKLTSNIQTKNEKYLEQLQHFNRYVSAHTQEGYQILILDGHESVVKPTTSCPFLELLNHLVYPSHLILGVSMLLNEAFIKFKSTILLRSSSFQLCRRLTANQLWPRCPQSQSNSLEISAGYEILIATRSALNLTL